MIHPDDLSGLSQSIVASASTLKTWRRRFRVPDPDQAGYRTLEARALPTREGDGSIVWFGMMFDVTDQQKIERELNEALLDQKAMLEAVSETVMEIADDGTLLRVHTQGPGLMGVATEDLVDRRFFDVFDEDVAVTFAMAMADARHAGMSSTHEGNYTEGGQTRYFSVRIVKKVTMSESEGQPRRPMFMASVNDITERKAAEERIRALVDHDELTALLNRRGFQGHLHACHAQSQRRQGSYALMFIDLDHFKHLNDSLGHEAGDTALMEIAQRLRENTRAADIVARLGGDEFVVLVMGDSPEDVQQQAGWLASRLIAAVRAPLGLEGGAFSLTCSIGIALGDPEQATSADILRWADLAMYSAKEAGRNGFRFFDQTVQSRMLSRIGLEQDLRTALAEETTRDESLHLHYQPIVNEQGHTLGYEALLRWTRSGKGDVPPNELIPVAEQSGLIVPIGYWVLQRACEILAEWRRAGPDLERFIAVNVSAMQIKQPDFVDTLSDIISETGADPGYLKLELTESLLHDDVDDTIQKLHDLRALGLYLSLDDFGTGYSSLAYLRKLPIHELKIDRSFVLHVLEQPDDAAVARMIVQLAQTLHMDVVAEGVETPEQLDFLISIGCRKFQGFMFGKPAPFARPTSPLQ